MAERRLSDEYIACTLEAYDRLRYYGVERMQLEDLRDARIMLAEQKKQSEVTHEAVLALDRVLSGKPCSFPSEKTYAKRKLALQAAVRVMRGEML